MLKNIFQFYITIAIPSLYLFILLVIYNSQNTLLVSTSFSYFGVVIAGIGTVLWLTSYVHLGKSFGVLPKKQNRITTGVYHYFKHPMYLGISLTMIGLSLAVRSYAGLTLTFLFLIPLLFLRAKLEERKLN